MNHTLTAFDHSSGNVRPSSTDFAHWLHDLSTSALPCAFHLTVTYTHAPTPKSANYKFHRFYPVFLSKAVSGNWRRNLENRLVMVAFLDRPGSRGSTKRMPSYTEGFHHHAIVLCDNEIAATIERRTRNDRPALDSGSEISSFRSRIQRFDGVSADWTASNQQQRLLRFPTVDFIKSCLLQRLEDPDDLLQASRYAAKTINACHDYAPDDAFVIVKPWRQNVQRPGSSNGQSSHPWRQRPTYDSAV